MMMKMKNNIMTYNIMKKMKDPNTGQVMMVLLLDGLSSILEINDLDKALNMALLFNQNSDSGWEYEVRAGGKIYEKELAKLTHFSKPIKI
mgnify:CR=1 FL=1